VVDGVKIAPGDVIIGDIDGVAIVPDDLAEEVLRNAEEKRDTENKVRKGIKEGMTPIEAYDEYRVF